MFSLQQQTYITERLGEDTLAVEMGYILAHQEMARTGEAPCRSKVMQALGLYACGVGGYECSCNNERIDPGVPAWDYVIGVDRALRAARRGIRP